MSLGYRIGQGYDVHRLVAGRRLILGGVDIDHAVGLKGHSDADVLTHAVIDAVLGAMALGDLGAHFPPEDPKYKDADSLSLLRHACELAAEAGGRPVNLDCTIYLEAPKVAPHILAMRERLAQTLELTVASVSVKATTAEGLGFVGKGEGAAASAVVLMQTGES